MAELAGQAGFADSVWGPQSSSNYPQLASERESLTAATPMKYVEHYLQQSMREAFMQAR